MTSPAPAELTSEAFDQLTGQGSNRRRRERRPYRVLQWAAAWPRAGVPDPSAYRQIRCHDISRGGLSYHTDQPPLDELMVVGLGSGVETIYLKCRVANCVRVDHRNGAFRIGCEFIERIEIAPAERPRPPAAAGAAG